MHKSTSRVTQGRVLDQLNPTRRGERGDNLGSSHPNGGTGTESVQEPSLSSSHMIHDAPLSKPTAQTGRATYRLKHTDANVIRKLFQSSSEYLVDTRQRLLNRR